MFIKDRIVFLNLLSITCLKIILNSHFGTLRFTVELKHFWHQNHYLESDLYLGKCKGCIKWGEWL